MSAEHGIASLVNKLALFVIVYGGLYISITSITITVTDFINVKGNDVPAIILGVCALCTVITCTIAFHFISVSGRRGWLVTVAAAPLLAGFGGLLINVSPYFVLCIAAFAPCAMILVNPAKTDKWTKILLDINEGGRIAVILGASAAILLLITDKLAFYTCSITYNTLAIALVVTSAYMVIRAVMVAGKQENDRGTLDAKHIADLQRPARVSAGFSIFSWTLFPIVIVLALKKLTMLSSFGSIFDPTTVGYLSILAVTGGAAIAALVLLFLRNRRSVIITALAFLAVLVACLLLFYFSSTLLDGNMVLAIHLLLAGSLPGSVMAMLGIPVPDAKGIAYHFWRGFMMIASFLLLVIGIAFKISNAETVFLVVYITTAGIAVVSALLASAAGRTVEVTAT
nr:hypothetical protein [Candidatus Sigynarchaeota archaeon]